MQMKYEISCPHCGHELTASEIKTLRGKMNGHITSEKKRRANAENGKKGGRPKKIRPLLETNSRTGKESTGET